MLLRMTGEDIEVVDGDIVRVTRYGGRAFTEPVFTVARPHPRDDPAMYADRFHPPDPDKRLDCPDSLYLDGDGDSFTVVPIDQLSDEQIAALAVFRLGGT